MSEQLTVSDPVRMRALSHPLRLELLDVLADGPATATECAAAVGQSVASCSFHLRTLEKYGFIERAEPRGREKPWRVIGRGQSFRPDDDVPESVRATEGLAALVLEHAAESVRAWISQLSDEDDATWNRAGTLTRSRCWLTVEELAELAGRIERLTEPYVDRNEDADLRPPDSRPVHLLGALHVDVVREQRDRTAEG